MIGIGDATGFHILWLPTMRATNKVMMVFLNFAILIQSVCLMESDTPSMQIALLGSHCQYVNLDSLRCVELKRASSLL
jgi:hypothetical protein